MSHFHCTFGGSQTEHQLLKRDSRHPSLHFKRVGRFWSVRVVLSFRSLGVEATDGVVWFWIGSHAEYDKLIDG